VGIGSRAGRAGGNRGGGGWGGLARAEAGIGRRGRRAPLGVGTRQHAVDQRWIALIGAVEQRQGAVAVAEEAQHRRGAVDRRLQRRRHFDLPGAQRGAGIDELKKRAESNNADPSDGDEHWWVHDFRRSGATALARLGADPIVVDMILSHKPHKLRGVAAGCGWFTVGRQRGRGAGGESDGSGSVRGIIRVWWVRSLRGVRGPAPGVETARATMRHRSQSPCTVFERKWTAEIGPFETKATKHQSAPNVMSKVDIRPEE